MRVRSVVTAAVVPLGLCATMALLPQTAEAAQGAPCGPQAKACLSLRRGESDLAIAGGVNLNLSPENFLGLSRYGMFAADGKCKFGDESANGFVRSEGASVVVLKTLDRARADDDRVYALILGSATNNDGRSGGYLGRPSALCQAE
ncbi:beta-ketoacyl synthase N-terminal-like domain-containing protein, partial [Kibdelosporangium lantanae]